jgi:hypothetical protein
MLYTSFRIKRETYRLLKKLRDKEKANSIDEIITLLLIEHDTLKIIKQQTNESNSH